MGPMSKLFPKLDLQQVCKPYHEYAELALSEANAEICFASLKVLDENTFCGFLPENKYNFDESNHICSYNATNMMECNMSYDTKVTKPCIWKKLPSCFWNGQACIKNSDLSDDFDVTCDIFLNQNKCEKNSSDLGECVVSSIIQTKMSSTSTADADYCSTKSDSLECNDATVHRDIRCKWQHNQFDGQLLEDCCRVSSSWCDEIYRYFNFLSEDKRYRGELTYRDICGPRTTQTRSRYTETELQQIDEECCYDVKEVLNPSKGPTNEFELFDDSDDTANSIGGVTNDRDSTMSSFPSPIDLELETLTQSPSHNFINLHDDDIPDRDTNTVHLEVYNDGYSSYVAKANIGFFSIIPVMVFLAGWFKKRVRRVVVRPGSEDISNLSQYEHVTDDSFNIGENVEDPSQFEHLQDNHLYHHVLDDSYDAIRHDMRPYEANNFADDYLDENILFPSLSEIYPDEPV